MNTDLKPCPFCGSPASLTALNGTNHYAFPYIECGGCPARMTHDTYTMPGAKLPDLMEAVVANWNRRSETKPKEGHEPEEGNAQ
jgi:Lar family restriction alleviation protein